MLLHVKARIRLDVHEDVSIVLLVFEVYQSFIHLLHLIAVLLVIWIGALLDTRVVVPRRSRNRVKISDLSTARHRLLIDNATISLLLSLVFLINDIYEVIACLRKVTYRLAEEILLLQQQVVVRRDIIFQVGRDAALGILNIKVRALMLHLSNKFVVYLDLSKYRGILLALLEALALVQIEPYILFDLLQPVSQGGLGHEDVLYQISDLVGQVASELVVR